MEDEPKHLLPDAGIVGARDALTTRIQGTATIFTAIASVSILALFQAVSVSATDALIPGIPAVILWVAGLTWFALALGGQNPFGRLGQSWRERYKSEIDIANRRLALGFYASFIAALLTLVALGLAKHQPQNKHATILLNDEGFSAVVSICPAADHELVGEVESDTIDSDVVVIAVDRGDCEATSKVVLRIPRTQIALVSQSA